MGKTKSTEPTKGELKVFDIIVKHGGPMTAYEISDKLGPSSKNRRERHTIAIINAKKLEGKRYLKPEKETTGRRMVHYSLTGLGVYFVLRQIEMAIKPKFDQKAYKNGLKTLFTLLPTIKTLEEFQSPLLNYFYERYPEEILKIFITGQPLGMELDLSPDAYGSTHYLSPALFLLRFKMHPDKKDEWVLRSFIAKYPAGNVSIPLRSPEQYDEILRNDWESSFKKRMKETINLGTGRSSTDKEIEEMLSQPHYKPPPYEEYKKMWEKDCRMTHDFLTDNKAIIDRLLSKMAEKAEKEYENEKTLIRGLRDFFGMSKD